MAVGAYHPIRNCSVNDEKVNDSPGCPIFGVESGGPIIGLGILVILLGIVPLSIDQIPLPVPVLVIFIGFGLFLIWTGLTK